MVQLAERAWRFEADNNEGVAQFSPFSVWQQLVEFADKRMHCCVDYFEALLWRLHPPVIASV